MQGNSEELVGLEVASLAKELGFDWPVLNYYFLSGNKWGEKEVSGKFNYNKEEYFISRPSQFLLSKWLREVHKKTYNIFDHEDEGEILFTFKEGNLGEEKEGSEYPEYENFEEATENALTVILTKLKFTKLKQNYEDFLEKYKPESFDNGEAIIFSGLEREALRDAENKNLLWTIISGSNGFDYIIKGWHYVDRVGYVIATVPYEKGSENSDEEYLY